METNVRATSAEFLQAMTHKPRRESIPKLVVERLPSPEAFRSIEQEWEALDRSLHPRTPFTSPIWNRLWWKHFGEQRLALRDEFFSHVVRDQQGALVAVAPMVITHRPGIGMLGVRNLQFFGADANVTELRGPVCREDDQPEVVHALLAMFRERANDWDWLHWYGIRERPETWAIIARGGELQKGEGNPDYVLQLPETWDAFRAGLSRNIKESLRKCYNSLKRDGHAFVFRAVEEPAPVRAAIERFFALHSARANVDTNVRHGDVFGSSRAREFLLDVAQENAERGAMRVFQLEIAGKVVATRIGFALGSELYLYFSGYDPEWGKYSVMTTVVAEAIKWAIEHGFKVVNLSPGSDVSKLRWGPQEILFGTALQLSERRRGRVAFHAYQALLNHVQSPRLEAFLQTVRRRH